MMLDLLLNVIAVWFLVALLLSFILFGWISYNHARDYDDIFDFLYAKCRRVIFLSIFWPWVLVIVIVGMMSEDEYRPR